MFNNLKNGSFTGYVPTSGSSVGTDANTMQYLCGLNVGASIHARNVQHTYDQLEADAQHEREMRELDLQIWQNERIALINEGNAIIQRQLERIQELEAALNRQKADSNKWYEAYLKMGDNVLILVDVLKKNSIPKPPLIRYDAAQKKYIKS